MILVITKDLFFVPTLQAAARNCGVELVTSLSVDSPKVEQLSAPDISACIVDLGCVPVVEIAGVFATLSQRFPQARLVGFGPHVQVQRLSAAEAAGCHVVLSRGQLSSQVDRLMPAWL